MSKIKNLAKYLVYQPKVDLNTLKIVGVEALIRFIDLSSSKILDTETIIDSIKSIEEMIMLTNEVLNMVIQDLIKLDNLNYKFNISINMSSKEICNMNLCSWIEKNFKEYKKYFNRIEIEITEKYEIEDRELMRERISLLKKLGFTISIDDVGAGFNQMGIIEDYNVDLVKIDRSMVRDFKNKKGELEYIVAITKEKNIKMLVEGIETEEDLKRFLDLGFEFGQGYYFYKAMRLEELIEKLDYINNTSAKLVYNSI